MQTHTQKLTANDLKPRLTPPLLISLISTVLSLHSDAYERLLAAQLGEARVVDPGQSSPCAGSSLDTLFPPSTSGTANLLFISMSSAKDFSSWLALAKCLRVWDLDARGYHRGLWRLHYNNTPLLVVGAPFSPYS